MHPRPEGRGFTPCQDKEAQIYTDSFYDEAISNGVKKISIQHDSFDSPEEYGRAISACNHALRKLY